MGKRIEKWERLACKRPLGWIVEFTGMVSILCRLFESCFDKSLAQNTFDDLVGFLKRYPSELQTITLEKLNSKYPELREGKLPVLPGNILARLFLLLPPTDGSYALLNKIEARIRETEQRLHIEHELEKKKRTRTRLFDVSFWGPRNRVVRLKAKNKTDAGDLGVEYFENGVTVNAPDKKRRPIHEWRLHKGIVRVAAGNRGAK